MRLTVISLTPDLVLDTLLYGSFSAPQSYGFGIPAHVPALFKPNGSHNWFKFNSRKRPQPAFDWLRLDTNGLGCHRYLSGGAFPRFPNTSPGLADDTPAATKLFKQVRTECRRRLENADEVLILGLVASHLQTADIELLRGLSPKRLTLVTSTPAAGAEVAGLCGLVESATLEVGKLDHWVCNRLLQWGSV